MRITSLTTSHIKNSKCRSKLNLYYVIKENKPKTNYTTIFELKISLSITLPSTLLGLWVPVSLSIVWSGKKRDFLSKIKIQSCRFHSVKSRVQELLRSKSKVSSVVFPIFVFRPLFHSLRFPIF